MKQKIDKELLLRVARNARLNLSQEEIKEFLPQFKEIVLAFEKISKIDVSKQEPSFQPLLVQNVFREDKVTESLTQEQALRNARHKKNGFFKGPKVVE